MMSLSWARISNVISSLKSRRYLPAGLAPSLETLKDPAGSSQRGNPASNPDSLPAPSSRSKLHPRGQGGSLNNGQPCVRGSREAELKLLITTAGCPFGTSLCARCGQIDDTTINFETWRSIADGRIFFAKFLALHDASPHAYQLVKSVSDLSMTDPAKEGK